MTKDKDPKDAKEPTDTRLFDTRTVERNIKRGSQTRKDYDKHLKSLPDLKDKIRTGE
jgi:molybdate-binding protein